MEPESAAQPVLIYSTWPDDAQARACAEALINERAAACVTILPGGVSTYRWEGKLEQSVELVMLAKTTASRALQARDLILKLHPYDVPCAVALRIDANLSNAPYLAWAATETA